MSATFVPTKEQADDPLLNMCFHAKHTECETIDILWREHTRLKRAFDKHLARCAHPREPFIVAYVAGTIKRPATDIIDGARGVVQAIENATNAQGGARPINQNGNAMMYNALIERLATAYNIGEDATKEGESFVNNGIRAVLAELSKMGVVALPDNDELRATCDEAERYRNVSDALYDLVRSHVAPILAAKDAEIARLCVELEAARADAARVAQEAREHHTQLNAQCSQVYDELMALRAENETLKARLDAGEVPRVE